MTAVSEPTAVDKTTDVAKLKGSINREVVEYIRRVLDLEEESVEIDRSVYIEECEDLQAKLIVYINK